MHHTPTITDLLVDSGQSRGGAFRARSSAFRLVSEASRRTKVIEVDVDEGLGRARLDELLHGIP